MTLEEWMSILGLLVLFALESSFNARRKSPTARPLMLTIGASTVIGLILVALNRDRDDPALATRQVFWILFLLATTGICLWVMDYVQKRVSRLRQAYLSRLRERAEEMPEKTTTEEKAYDQA